MTLPWYAWLHAGWLVVTAGAILLAYRLEGHDVERERRDKARP